MRLVIEGHDLPGLACEFDAQGNLRSNVHVGIQLGRLPAELKPADATTVRWTTDIEVLRSDVGFEFRGKAVQGKKGERFVYLTWGEPEADGSFDMFRRAKLMLNRIDVEIVDRCLTGDVALVASVHLTDDSGMPRCARVDPPAIAWSAGG